MMPKRPETPLMSARWDTPPVGLMRVMPGGLEVRSNAATASRANTHEPLLSLSPGEMAMYVSGPGGGV